MESEFVKVDLHVHTPASHACYIGSKEDGEYFKIIKKAKSKNVKVIAITDHNSIKGYKKLMELKDELLAQKKSLSQITDSMQSKQLLKNNESLLALFEDILILPGVEFEVNNGIHMLIIFNQKTGVDQIERFIIDGGYSQKDFGLEMAGTLARWDIFTFLRTVKKI
jgi:histidinol phosphatase-like PHP family hydrolase